MRIQLIVSCVLLSTLTACMTPEQIAQQRAWQAEQDYNACVEYGLRPGTESFANCRMQLDLVRRQPVYVYDRGYYPRFSYHHWH